MGILLEEEALMLHNRRGKMVVSSRAADKTETDDKILPLSIESILESEMPNPRTQLDYVDMQYDISDNMYFRNKKAEMEKHQRIVSELKRLGKSLSDACLDIQNKVSTFSRNDREYLLEWAQEIVAENIKKSEKGGYDGLCNRSACLKPGAKYFNYSTEKYYCSECARLINNANRNDAIRMYGHDLCMYQSKELKQ